MRHVLWLSSIAVVALSGFAAAQEPAAKPPKPEIGKLAPDASLTTHDGKATYKLSELRDAPAADGKPARAGKVVVLDFWCHTCPGSRAYDARLSDVAKRYAEKGVLVLAVNPTLREADDAMRGYIAQNQITFPVCLDAGNAATDAFAAEVTPHFFVMDRAGVLRYVGALDNRKNVGEPDRVPHLENALDAILGGTAVPQATTRPFG